MKITPQILYEKLKEKYGNLNWWPIDETYHEKNSSDPRFEIIVGAILTQNTAWSNVEKALEELKLKKMLNVNKIKKCKIQNLQRLIKSSGFFNQKADRIKIFSNYLINNYNGNLDNFFNKNTHVLRNELLSLNGIGPETADSILLYAGNKPIFVIDAYTKRLSKRLPINNDIEYNKLQQFFEKELKKNYSKEEIVKVFNELHALIVIFAKNYCRKKPLCDNCLIKDQCHFKK